MGVQDEVMKSRITLTYRTEIDGQPVPKELPFRVMVAGDLSGGTSKDRQEKLANRDVRSFDGSNTNELIKDMGITIDLNVDNKIDPAKEASLNISIPINGMRSFAPDEIAQRIPKARQLLEIKKLLQEGLTALGNRPELAEAFKKVYADKEAHKSLKAQLKPLDILKLPDDSSEVVPVEIDSDKEGS